MTKRLSYEFARFAVVVSGSVIIGITIGSLLNTAVSGNGALLEHYPLSLPISIAVFMASIVYTGVLIAINAWRAAKDEQPRC